MQVMVIIIAEILVIWKMRKFFLKRKDIRWYKMKILKNILNWFVFLLTGKGELADEMVDEGLIDYSGQGRNEYGK